MDHVKLCIAFMAICAIVNGQQVETNTPENHPQLTVETCTKSGGCQTQSKSVVIDSNWRRIHITSDKGSCYIGNQWDKSVCPDGITCAHNCALGGADYADYTANYGVATAGAQVHHKWCLLQKYWIKTLPLGF